jgi:hypothetical protein
MAHFSSKIKKWLGRALLGVLLLGTVSVGMAGFAGSAQAESDAAFLEGLAFGPGKVSALSSDLLNFAVPAKGATTAKITETIWSNMIGPAARIALYKAGFDLVQYALDRAAYEGALYIANGGVGRESLFYGKSATEASDEYFNDVAGKAFEEIRDFTKEAYGTSFDFCAPSNPLIKLNIQLGLKQAYKPRKPRCDYAAVINNWNKVGSNLKDSFIDPNTRNQYLLKTAASSLRPGKNELGAAIGLNFSIANKSREVSTKKFFEQINSDGFKDVKNIVTGKVKTPSSIVQKKFNEQLAAKDETKINPEAILGAKDPWKYLAATTASTFANTLFSTLVKNIYDGLFEEQPDSFNPWDIDGLASNDAGNSSLSQTFSSIPIALANYKISEEFITCDTSGSSNRGLNQCVYDQGFASAVEQGSNRNPITVQEAIETGALHGEWFLYSPEDLSKNQDLNCKDYGYCYGNLVKLRKARVISVGWELAALKSPVNSPIKLKDVVNGFDKCNSNGESDENNPYCHLIDPNWVIKAPEAQCNAVVNGEVRISSLSPGRQNVCVDSPTCIGEDSSGQCSKGFGYCVQEKNVWRVQGDDCPEEFATCLSLTDTQSNQKGDFLVNTVDFSVCNKGNAGCAWYRTNKYFNDGGTDGDFSDDSFEWLAGSETYSSAGRENDLSYQTGAGAASKRVAYNYKTTSDQNRGYSVFSYEDRVYFNHASESCSADSAGCSELIKESGNTALNVIQNPSFERGGDVDGSAESWIGEAIRSDKETSFDGSFAVSPSILNPIYQTVPVKENNFYTFSVYEKGLGSFSANVSVLLNDGSLAPLGGLSFGGDCEVDKGVYSIFTAPGTKEWSRYRCTFTTPKDTASVRVSLGRTMNVLFDGVQLEVGETASGFGEGYIGAKNSVFLKLAPEYYGCSGKASDPKECEQFTQVCQAQDVGCNLYTPEDGDPSVPAIASSLDECPSECVGYDAFKQEATTYDDAEFPIHFIPSKATSCSSQYVGCDGFTNLSDSVTGGETQEYYSGLRACLTEGMTDDNSSNKKSAVFFTWEGSENAGYQLKTWNLLESNTSKTKLTFSNKAEEKNPALAPCINWSVESETEVVCNDTNPALALVEADTLCDEHDDILADPDCREFFDEDGDVHYRRYSQTISIDNACTPYRKDVSKKTDCDSSGGYWTDQGFCRYYGLQSESVSCPAEQNGCRAYTGGAGRNAITKLDETFENGNEHDFESFLSGSLQVSKESVGVDGHSLRVKAGGATSGVEVSKYKTEIKQGKTFVVKLWAKGDGKLFSAFTDKAGLSPKFDLVDPKVSGAQSVDLNSSWKVYEFGPLDTSGGSFADFNKDSSLVFYTDAGKEFFIDNITLKQVEENITIIKDTWVVPSSCDQTEEGILSPQKFLGCEAYSDQNSITSNLYQFSSLCSEKVVGCEGFYNTQNSESEYIQVNNARCVYSSDSDLADGDVVTKNTACEIFGKEYCTILNGKGHCTFSSSVAFENPLPFDTSKGDNFGIVYGPETVVTSTDTPEFLVNNGSYTCTEALKGCEEIGLPIFSQDKKIVSGFTSAYVVNNPDNYENILCNNEELFCEEFDSNNDGLFYFKDPGEKLCEYKTSVNIDGKSFYGWFQEGTSEPCYSNYVESGDRANIWRNGDNAYDGWVGQCQSNYDRCTELIDVVDTGKQSTKGQSYFVLNNKKISDSKVTSQGCEGTVGQKGGCALFNNTTKSDLKYNASASYVLSTHSDIFGKGGPKGLSNQLVDPINCDTGGGVYKVLKSDQAKFALPGEIDLCARRCSYSLTKGDKIISPSAQSVGLCKGTSTTCSVDLDCGSQTTCEIGNWLERSCLIDTDCPKLETAFGQTAYGSCGNVTKTNERLVNDTNMILNVARDRSCGSWLTCDSSKTSWNELENKYTKVCDSIRLCTEGSNKGNETVCEKWGDTVPQILTEQLYSSRDTNWTGYDYSGYSIPNKLPVEFYDQFNVNPDKWCENTDGSLFNGKVVSCTSNSDCGTEDSVTCKDVKGTNYCFGKQGQMKDKDSNLIECPSGTNAECATTCQSADVDYRLVYNAGPCDSENKESGLSCKVGFCEDTGAACAVSSDCGKGTCVIGYCQAKNSKDINFSCSKDTDCKGKTSSFGNPTEFCQNTVCVDVNINTDLKARKACAATSDCGGQGRVCVDSAESVVGACYNNRCVTDIEDTSKNGHADKLEMVAAEPESCRGYPEYDSPFPNKVVTEWEATIEISDQEKFKDNSKDNVKITSNDGVTDIHQWAKASSFVSGFNQSKVCAPDKFGNVTDDCLCTYKKVEYGDSNNARYYSTKDSKNNIESAICIGGLKDGQECNSDEVCKVYEQDKGVDTKNVISSGRCEYITGNTTANGWKGYCIERDTSIQINGGSGSEDLACITWLPVDQLSGATDLYGKYTTAGFELENSYYCADVKLGHDVATSSIACAEWPGGVIDIGCDDEESDWKECSGGVYCPNGHFAVMTACGAKASKIDSEADDNDCTDSGDDDCPYFCVPEESYKTEGLGEKGKACKPPTGVASLDVLDTNVSNTKLPGVAAKNVFDHKIWGKPKYDIFPMTSGEFTKAWEYYNDCVVQGIVGDNIHDYTNGSLDPSRLPDEFLTTDIKLSGAINDNGFYKLYGEDAKLWNYKAYPVCSSLVQVGNQDISDDGSFNTAWTNRIWEKGKYTITDALKDLNFSYFSGISPFGKSLSVKDLKGKNDVPAPKIISCTSNNERTHAKPIVTDGVLSCPDKYDETALTGDDALSYLDFEVNEIAKSTEKDADKFILQNAGLFNYTGYSKIEKVSKFDKAVSSLQQLFAQSYKLHTFDDQSLVKGKTGDFTDKKLKVSDNWGWDVRATGDNNKTPSGPEIYSVGLCTGTQCFEQSKGKFSVNGTDSGDLPQTGAIVGQKRVDISFYVNADPDQMPIRKVLVDWGDGVASKAADRGKNIKGSQAPDNFYKNQRGKELVSQLEQCDGDDFGSSPGACASSYAVFTHDYVCSESELKKLESRTCKEENGIVVNSPCSIGKTCVFQPRIFVEDNWGWCTGFCAGGEDGTNGCFGGSQDECNYQQCPGGNKCIDSKGNVANPWINYDGRIVLTPK